jgi:hypothetical protein
VLVLLVVPALLAIGHDLGRNIRAARRAFASGARAPGMGLALGVAALGMTVAFVFTLGSVIVRGAMPAALGGGTSAPIALGVFVAVSAAITIVVWLLASVRMAARRAST